MDEGVPVTVQENDGVAVEGRNIGLTEEQKAYINRASWGPVFGVFYFAAANSLPYSLAYLVGPQLISVVPLVVLPLLHVNPLAVVIVEVLIGIGFTVWGMISGRRVAWQSHHWPDFVTFQRQQEKWNFWGKVYVAILVLLVVGLGTVYVLLSDEGISASEVFGMNSLTRLPGWSIVQPTNDESHASTPHEATPSAIIAPSVTPTVAASVMPTPIVTLTPATTEPMSGGMQVTGVTAASTLMPADGCAQQASFTAVIAANGPGTVSYTWQRSDGAIAPVETLTFAAAGSKLIVESWFFGPTAHFRGWEQVEIISPNNLLSNKATFVKDPC